MGKIKEKKEEEVKALNDRDKKQIRALGITEDHVLSQIERFEKGAPYLKLDRPCTIGDGIKVISEEELEALTVIFKESTTKRRLTKFVPASGAASRMFKALLRFNNEYTQTQRTSIASQAQQGDGDSQHVLAFMDGIRQFAFLDDLESAMAVDGLDPETLISSGEFKEVIDYLLTQKGLGYAQRPKGLLKFHKYPDGNRTAFEEHLVEAANYAKDGKGTSCLHFTVSPKHRKRFEALLETIRSRYKENYGAHFDVSFSVQEKSTDNVAVDLENKPFRLNDGSILFRPGGHGALIENLNDTKGDIIYIKNIDNVVPDRLKDQTFLWKKALGGYLIKTQQKIFYFLERLAEGPPDKVLLEEALEFVEHDLCIIPPGSQALTSDEAKQDFLLSRLNRPIRVCGMVRNQREPGGGPFWVEDRDGSLSLQIVETAQIDPESEAQQSILRSSTHFNPVDIVCGVLDWEGKAFDLRHFVDPEAVFISMKSKEGQDLKALELPGLWNGAMSYWHTIFVEVPVITFNPVKTINDLLRKEHQPD